MKVLIIGGTGQLGEVLIKQLAETSHTIIVPKRVQLDISRENDAEYWMRSYTPDVVINTAAYHNLNECEINPDMAYKINHIGIENLVRLCSEYNCKFITFSTDYVFDGVKNKPYTENDTPNPLQVYGLSKLMGERSALQYNKSVIIRTCGVYGGAGSRSKGGNCVLNRIHDAAYGKMTISSNQYASPTYAHDLAKATLELMELDEYGIFHLVNAGCCSWYVFSKEIIKNVGIKCVITPSNQQQIGTFKRPLNTSLTNIRAKRLGIVLPKWENGLKRYLKQR